MLATPVVRPLLYQGWYHLTFLHWALDPMSVRPLVPREFDLDTFDGKAWIGVVPFLIRGSRFPGVPWRIDFPETNVRTYVRAPSGETGVWFFSLDAGKLAPVIGARVSFGLPYFAARMHVDVAGNRVHYRSRRVGSGAAADITVETGDAIGNADPLGIFLINRYRLYTKILGRIAHGEVDHVPYPLARVKLVECVQNLYPIERPPDAIHYSPGVEVRIAAPRFDTIQR